MNLSTTMVIETQMYTLSYDNGAAYDLFRIQVMLGLASIITLHLTLDLSAFARITGSVMAVLLAGITTMELETRLQEMERLRNERSLRKRMN